MLIRDLRSLVKPRIVGLLCVTGASAHLAAGGTDFGHLAEFLLAGGFIAAGVAALNCVYDRDIDRLMDRTADRPIPAGDLSPSQATVFGVALLLTGTGIGLTRLPLISVAFMHLGMLAYLGLYTVLLKRRHPIGVVLGGSAGSFPVLAGWSAVEPLTSGAIAMASLVFLWTPAHAWALAVAYREDFSAASIPTLPVVADEGRVRWGVTVSAVLTVLFAASLVTFSGRISTVTVVTAGPLFLVAVRGYHRVGTDAAAVRVFFTSNLYLAVVFAAWAADGAGVELPPAGLLLVAITVVGAFGRLWSVRPSLGGVRCAPVHTRWWSSRTITSGTVDDFRP